MTYNETLNVIYDRCQHCEETETAFEVIMKQPCEDAISIPKYALKTRVGNIVAYNVEWLKKHWQMEMDIVCGVKSCEDAISREAVVDDFVEWREKLEYMAGEDYSGVHLLNDAIQKIWDKPSVTPSIDLDKHDEELIKETVANIWGKEPSRRKGHWIDYSDEGYVECPFCGHATTCEDNIDELHYCFYCGHRMESEDV